jgi:hypothetical protein
MAVVKTKKMRLELDPDKPYKETIIKIRYDGRSGRYNEPPAEGRFYITLPDIMAGSLGITEVRARTQDDVDKLFEEALEQFRNLRTEVNDVILYSIYTQPSQASKYYHDEGYALKIWAGTFRETVATAGDGTKRYSYERVEGIIDYPGEIDPARWSRRGKKYTPQVPWTNENEIFFKWVADNLKILIERLDELQSPELLIETINAGRLLPVGAPGNTEGGT